MKNTFILSLFCALLLCPFEAHSKETLTGSGLPLPRFVSLRTNKVNMRTGPGTRYPIEWVLKQKGLPLEITAEFDVWRRVRAWEGTEGWVHQSTLSSRRSAIISGETQQQIRRNNTLSSPVKALVDPSAIGKILMCDIKWCKVQFDNVKGYLSKTSFWGAYRGEEFK